MKELPILFITLMVQANMEDRKGMTRRLTGLEKINVSPDKWKPRVQAEPTPGREKYGLYHYQSKKGHLRVLFDVVNGDETEVVDCPYGKIGDILWVRETYKNVAPFAKVKSEELFVYKADDPNAYPGMKWKPSIHMQKRAARIWLQVIDVRIERLHDITQEDAIAEGVEKRPGTDQSTKFDYKHYGYELSYDVDAKVSFRTLWDKVNGPDSWGANPWVWVISYKILSKTGRPETFPAYVKEAVR